VTDRGLITAWLETACLAPSPHNNQPWAASVSPASVSPDAVSPASVSPDAVSPANVSPATVSPANVSPASVSPASVSPDAVSPDAVSPDAVSLRLDRELVPPTGPDRLQFMALGAFIENMAYAAAVDGYQLTVDEPPIVPRRSSQITVRFRCGAQPGGRAALMLDGARRRRTERGPYQPALPAGAAETLRAVDCEPGTGLTLLEDPADRSAAAGLAGRAMRVVFSVPELRRDLARFVFTAADAPRSTGMPLASMNRAAPAEVPGRTWVLDLASADEEAEAARERFEHAPVHFVVTSRADTLPGWIAGGRTLQRVLVTATVLGLSHCLAAGPSEIPTLLPALRRLTQGEGRPLILGRLGVPSAPAQGAASPRRPVADVVSG
jgi:hypothetical protein